MGPKPAMEQMGVSYRPVLLSWETWTPHVYAGSRVRLFAHVVNDAEDFSDLTGAWLAYALRRRDGKGGPVAAGETDLPAVKYFAHGKVPVTVEIPREVPTGDYVLAGRITRGGEEVAGN